MRPFSKLAFTQSADLHWNEATERQPEQSGVYLTRNDRNQHWYKFFNVHYGLWYMSWAELKDNAPRSVACVSGPDIAAQVVSWTHCPRRSGMNRPH